MRGTVKIPSLLMRKGWKGLLVCLHRKLKILMKMTLNRQLT